MFSSPTYREIALLYFRIPPTEVGGFFRSSLLAHNTATTVTKSVRLDLNYPPTPVGGIADFDEDAASSLDLKISTHW
jgi:hypothetical protein